MALRRSGVRIPSAPFTFVFRSPVAFHRAFRSAASLCFLMSCMLRAGAQSADGTRLIVLVQPMGSATAVVMTYSGVVPHTAARARVMRLAEATGATVATVEVRDTTVAGTSRSDKSRVVQTGVEALMTGMEFSTDRAFLLQPFIAALGDVGRFEVMFLTRKVDGFAGIRHWDSDGVTVHLLQDGAPYRYRFAIASRAATAANLPVYQPEARQPSRGTDARRTQAPLQPWLLVSAGICGGAVFVIMLVRARFRAADRTRQFTAEKGGVGDHA